MFARLSDHLYLTDFQCKCDRPYCQVVYLDEALVDSVELVWQKAGGLIINSGHRCTAHNAAIGGRPGSLHLSGKACDMVPKKLSIPEFLVVVQSIPRFKDGGIGVYKTFIHGDVRGYCARWTG